MLSLLHGQTAEKPEGLREERPLQSFAIKREERPKSKGPEPVSARPAVKEPAAERNPAPGTTKGTADQQAVIQKWPEIRKRISTQWQSLYSLNLMRLEAGASGDELILRAPKAIYCQQLEMKGGEKLTLIENQIEEATGLRYRVRVVNDEKPRIGGGDLSDIMNQIHTDVNWRK